MMPENLNDDLLRIMKAIWERGGTECSGSCHHRKPGEFHCHLLGQELNISSSGVKERILVLVRIGMLNRTRLERPGTFPVTTFTVSEEGRRVLAARGEHPER